MPFPTVAQPRAAKINKRDIWRYSGTSCNDDRTATDNLLRLRHTNAAGEEPETGEPSSGGKKRPVPIYMDTTLQASNLIRHSYHRYEVSPKCSKYLDAAPLEVQRFFPLVFLCLLAIHWYSYFSLIVQEVMYVGYKP